MAIAVPWGPSMATNGPSMGIDEVALRMIPSMGYRWIIDDPSMGIEIFGNKNSFDLAMFKISKKLSPYKFFSLFKFCWGFFYICQIFYSEMKLYIIIHIIYFCEKLDSVNFPRKKQQIFLIQKRILRVKFLHISDNFSSYKQMVFSTIEARFRRIFMIIIAFCQVFVFFQTIQGQGSETSDFQARECLLRLKRK